MLKHPESLYNEVLEYYNELQRQLSNLQHGQETGGNGYGRTDDVPGGSGEESV